MSIQNLFQQNDYDIYADSLNVNALNAETLFAKQLTLNDGGSNAVVMYAGNTDTLVVSGPVYCSSLIFGVNTVTPQTNLSYYTSKGTTNIIFQDSNTNLYTATYKVVRIGNFVNLTIRPSADAFTVPTTCDFMDASAVLPSDLRPEVSTFFATGALVSGAGQMMYGVITAGGSIQLTAINGNSQIPAASYVTGSFNVGYYCNA